MHWNRARISIAFFCAIVVFLTAILAMTGWWTHTTSLIQILPTFVPMQFNTALCFLLIAIAFFFTYGKSLRVISYILCALVFLLSFLTLLEYILRIDMHIDELFIQHYITTRSLHPGRMAPNTALCMMFSAIAIGASLLRTKHLVRFSVPSLFSAVVFALGLIALIGYALSVQAAYTWRHITSMAVHTALAFCFLSLGIYCHTIPARQIKGAISWIFYPMGLSAIYVLLTFIGLLESFSLTRNPSLGWLLGLLFSFLFVVAISIWIFHNAISSIYTAEFVQVVNDKRERDLRDLVLFIQNDITPALRSESPMVQYVRQAIDDMAELCTGKATHFLPSERGGEFSLWVEQLRTFFEGVAEKKEATIEYCIAPPAQKITFDEQKVSYIIYRLVLHCMEEGDHVRLEIATKEKSRGKQSLCLRVTGRGDSDGAKQIVLPTRSHLLPAYVSALHGSIWYETEDEQTTFICEIDI